MAKNELYEYQYTTPNKKVVKECLPAVRKPEGKKKQKNKAFWGKVMLIAGGAGLLSALGGIATTNAVTLFFKILIWGMLAANGFRQMRTSNEYLGRIDRYMRYMKALEDKKYASLEELSQKVAKNVKTVTKDLEFMMDNKWFLEGHLDQDSGQFMLTDYMYEQYKLLEQGKRIQQQEEQERQELENDPVKKEVVKVIEEGKAYIKEIRILNDVILGDTVSDQLDRMEEVLKSIFELVKRKPEKVSDLRKLMQYYLPMTIKVVSSYRDFENETVPSEQIRAGKQEIEETLEKVYKAFVNLREKLFQEDVLDVSTDLDVLEAMMSQEGLMEEDLPTFGS